MSDRIDPPMNVAAASHSIDGSSAGLSAAQMREVLEISRLFAITADQENLLHKIANAVCSLLACERASIWLHDPVSDELFTTVTLDSRQLRVPRSTGIVGAAFNTNQSVLVPNAYDDPRFNPSSDVATGFKTRGLLAMPMVDIDGKPVGVIQAVNKRDGRFGSQDEPLLHLLADQAGVAIQRHRLQLIARQAAEMSREMNLARGVQQAMLPQSIPQIKGFDIAGWARAASITGGDCYDLWRLADGRVGILLCDASGHGLAPALVVSQARTLVRALSDGPTTTEPHEVLQRVNRTMSNDLAPDRFITAFLAFLSQDGTLQWQSAGHAPIFLRASAGAVMQLLDAVLPPINAMSELPDESPAPMKLQPGGILAVMSDGIFEAFSPGGELFGTDAVVQSLDESKSITAAAAVQSLIASVGNWQQHDQPIDDQTIVLLNCLALN